ncbi:hypothetical protein E2C01_076164 [Portunus trituberculatus]|uniref:Uncharacterized protein n=1 Tax=Portunus trituberculatus TaxID=210409 RepID=A0A5B7ICH9_PORTR|nr:hypothetical protein [Portunus trituberculatus]
MIQRPLIFTRRTRSAAILQPRSSLITPEHTGYNINLQHTPHSGGCDHKAALLAVTKDRL